MSSGDSKSVICFKLNARIRAYEPTTNVFDLQDSLRMIAMDAVRRGTLAPEKPPENELHEWLRGAVIDAETSWIMIAGVAQGMRRQMLIPLVEVYAAENPEADTSVLVDQIMGIPDDPTDEELEDMEIMFGPSAEAESAEFDLERAPRRGDWNGLDS